MVTNNQIQYSLEISQGLQKNLAICKGLTSNSGSALKSIWDADPRFTNLDEDRYHPDSCKQNDDDEDFCYERCVIKEFESNNLPRYGIRWGRTDCQKYAKETSSMCMSSCRINTWRRNTPHPIINNPIME